MSLDLQYIDDTVLARRLGLRGVSDVKITVQDRFWRRRDLHTSVHYHHATLAISRLLTADSGRWSIRANPTPGCQRRLILPQPLARMPKFVRHDTEASLQQGNLEDGMPKHCLDCCRIWTS